MNKKIEEVLSEFPEIIKEAQQLTFLPRDQQLQEESIAELSDYIDQLNSVQRIAINDRDEDTANRILAIRCSCRAVHSELRMWLSLKEENWAEAWDHLVDAQDFLRSAQASHELMRTPNIKNMQSKYEWIEKFVFPPQIYMSPGFVVTRFTCSICGNDYSECEHIDGLPYWGQICSRIIEDTNVREVSVVNEPEDKKCRIIQFSTDDGYIRNKMTWEKKEPDEVPNFPDFEPGEHIFTGIVMKPDGVYDTTTEPSDDTN